MKALIEKIRKFKWFLYQELNEDKFYESLNKLKK